MASPFQRGLVASALLLSSACEQHSPPKKQPTIVTVSGTLIYTNNDLEPIVAASGNQAFVARTVGLTSVEFVSRTGDGFAAVTLDAPPIENTDCTARSPVALSVANIDSDSLADIMVSDPCGNWIALAEPSGDYAPSAWSDWLPPVPAYPFLTTLAGAGNGFLVTGTGDEIQQLDGTRPTWAGPSSVLLPTPTLANSVTKLLLPPNDLDSTQDPRLLVQGYRQLVAVPFGTASGVAPSRLSVVSQVTQPGYLVPFDAFDHLAWLGLPACSGNAVGIGLVSSFGGPFPRRLQLLRVGASSFEAQQIDVGIDSVTTLAVVARPDL